MTDERLKEIIETTKGHTPGPWKNRMYLGGAFEIQLENAAGDRVEHIAVVDGSARTIRNSYLIAAAPELITALTEARDENKRLRDENMWMRRDLDRLRNGPCFDIRHPIQQTITGDEADYIHAVALAQEAKREVRGDVIAEERFDAAEDFEGDGR